MRISYIKKPTTLPIQGVKPLLTIKEDEEFAGNYYFGSTSYPIMMSEQEVIDSHQKGDFIKLIEAIKYKQNHTLCVCSAGNLYYCKNEFLFKKMTSNPLMNIANECK